MKNILRNTFFITVLTGMVCLTACKEADTESTDTDNVTIKADTVSPVGSDGMDRKVDSVNIIARDAEDPVNEYEARP